MEILDTLSHISLSEVETGHSGRIKLLDMPQETASRLAGLGICEGRNIHIVKKGEPYIVRTYGSRVGIASSLAHLIQVVLNKN